MFAASAFVASVLALAGLTLVGCCGGGEAAGLAPVADTMSAPSRLGELNFNDVSPSASGQQASSSCHDAAHGGAAANNLPAQPGGATLALQGGRNSPGIRYLSSNHALRFTADGTPSGGFFWDGRAGSLQDQAGKPFLNPLEMANANVAELVGRLSRATCAAQFQQVFGADIFSRPDEALARVTLSLQQCQPEAAQFRAYSSKFDAFPRGRARLSAAEQRGLALFNSPAKGNCAACHPSARSTDGSQPLFTDFSDDAIGVPRNPALRQNADPGFFDLGLCARPDGAQAARTDLCGAFRVPSWRNVALREAYFQNRRFSSRKEAMTFYVQRDTQPEKWYPLREDCTVDKFDDLPPAWRTKVNRGEAPYNRQPGQATALSDAEIDDVIAFLATLSDGFAP